LCERLGTLSEDGTQYVFADKEKAQEFQEELTALLDTQVELRHTTLTLDKLGSAEIAPTELMALDWLVVEELLPNDRE